MRRRRNPDLHGAAPHRSPSALVLIDVVNAMSFPGGKLLARRARPVASRIAALKRRAKAAGVPVVYANDNYGQWRSDLRTTLAHATAAGMPGRDVSRLLAPEPDDYFILKPKHSAFYGTALELLLSYLGSDRLVLAGFATNFCVQFTAQDAFLRDLDVVVASDAVASETAAADRAALRFMRRQLHVRVARSPSIRFG